LKKIAFYQFYIIVIVISIICLSAKPAAYAASASINVSQDVTTVSNKEIGGVSKSYTVGESEDMKDLTETWRVNWVGSATDLDLEYERAAVKFSLAGITGTITAATFKFYVADVEGSPVVNIIPTEDDTWNETDSSPAFPTYDAENILYSMPVTPDDCEKFKEFDVKDYIQSCVDAGKTNVVFVLTGIEGEGLCDFNFISNQDVNIDLWSKLDLTYTPVPTPPTVTGPEYTGNTRPTWSWTAGEGGNGTFRYKLDNNDLSSGATTTTSLSYTPGSDLSNGSHTLYVQESNGEVPARWSDSGSFTITVVLPAPVVSSISPTSGPSAGGTSITISGTGFTGATGVKFGSTAATGYTVDSDTSITATSPAGSGTVDVTVTTSGGTSATGSGDQFTYILDNGGLNYDLSVWATTPSMTVYDGKLYTTWVENTSGHTQIRVKKYNGTTWENADSGSLNMDTQKGAYNPILMPYGSDLYLAWYEETGADYQVYGREYNRTANSWENVEDLSYSANKAFNVKLAACNNILYAVWLENNGIKNQVRAKVFAGSTWNQADPGTLNCDPAQKATLPSVAVYSNTLFAAWSEKGNIRVKKYDGGTSWSTADNNTSINIDSTKFADMPILLADSSNLYIIWAEQDNSGIYQIRAKKYNGTSWDQIDSGSLNDSSSQDASMLNGTMYNNILYAAWTENGKVKIKSYASGTWKTADDINYDLSKASSGPAFAEYDGKLYVSWKEGSGTADKIRAKVYAGE
jgi:hypothetical protein